ncbi:MAG: beta-propeller repeat protein [Chthonomonadaceae bacterium]|nr:beta-propeller repeat protein [Chthonomonadaceae bacterium]
MHVSRPVRNLILLLPAAGLLYGAMRLAAKPADRSPDTAIIGKQPDGTYFVPTGQTLSPTGKNITFDGRPVDMALRPDGKMLALMCQRGTRLFNVQTQEFLPDLLPGSHDFGGIVWSKDGHTLYTTGKAPGTRRNGTTTPPGAVFVTHIDDSGTVTQTPPIGFALKSRITPNKNAKDSQPCGLALSPDEKSLYVTLFNNGTLAAVDLSSYNAQTGEATYAETPVGSSPEKVVVSRDGSKIYVANRGGKVPEAGDTLDEDDPVVVDPKTYKASTGTVSVVAAAQIATDAEHAVSKTISVGLQPTDMTFSADGSRLFVANANNDSVSVIGVDSDTVVETIATSPAPGRLAASSPNGLAVSKDGGTLYVTLGGDNAVAVISLDAAAGGAAPATKIAGLIPTAWFPLGVTLSPDSSSLYVANSKGIGSLGSTVTRARSEGAAMPQAGPGGTLQSDSLSGHSVYSVLGSLGVIPVPDRAALAQLTAIVTRNDHFDRMAQAVSGKRDAFWSRFKHVILVIKENRTYDQLFADIPVPPGHIGGDPSLLMFGEKITPNHHAIAHEFGLFDNLYCSGAISADGHHWLNEAFADDYSERAMNNYPRSYPCCGTDPLVYAGNKFLWQAAMDGGRTFRNYGEFNPLPSIRPHSDAGYNGKFQVGPDRNQDVAHSERILKDLAGAAPLADLTTIWFPNDHTSGTRPGSYTPESDIADNDLAVGKLVDAVSHSTKYWHDEPTVIFVVEDDAQGGLDHVEGHRTVALIASPFNKRGQIFSTNFNQLNMLRTIEQILNIPPLNQFDAAAIPMRSVFQEKGDFQPYTVRKNLIALNAVNPPLKKLTGTPRRWAEVSSRLDFSAPDRANPEQLTEALWHHTHGDAAYPPPTASR